MPNKGKDDKSLISERGPTDTFSPSGSIGTGPKSQTFRHKAEEIPQAEIIVESEAHSSLHVPTEVPIFKAESDGSAALPPRMPAETQAKQTSPKSTPTENVPNLRRSSPVTTIWGGGEFDSIDLEHTDQVFTEIQPPLAVLAIAFLVLLFLI